MAIIRISKEDLVENHGLPYEGFDGVEVVENKITGTSRWSIHYKVVFKWTDGKFYSAKYRTGATESQDEQPWEYDDKVECTEVALVEKVVKVWEPV